MVKMMGEAKSDRIGQMAEMRFAKLDTNGDGQLSADELAADNRFTRVFKRIDRNGDGTLGKDELAQAQTWMEAHAGKKHGRKGDCGDRGFGHRGMVPQGADQQGTDQQGDRGSNG